MDSFAGIAFLIAYTVGGATVSMPTLKLAARRGEKNYRDAIVSAALAFLGAASVIDVLNLIGVGSFERWMAYALFLVHWSLFSVAVHLGRRNISSGHRRQD